VSSASCRFGPVVDRSSFGRGRGLVRLAGGVDKQREATLDDGAGRASLAAFEASTGLDGKAPTMIAANERFAFEFALAEQRALMRAPALEGSPTTYSAGSSPPSGIVGSSW
jgi:hypothetical protein